MMRPKFAGPFIEDRGENGNIAVMTAICTAQMRKLGVSRLDIEELRTNVRNSESYKIACDFIRGWFHLTTDLIPKSTYLRDILYDGIMPKPAKLKRKVMGYYINPSDGSEKEDWLARHAQPIRPEEAANFDFNKGMLPVCLVDNGAFTAAGIAYDARERNCFLNSRGDKRPKKWFTVKKELLKEWYDHD